MATQAERDEILRNADIPGIGSHCDVETCKQLDFLPFNCESCKGYVPRSVSGSVHANNERIVLRCLSHNPCKRVT